MINVPLNAVPNQSLSIQLDNINYFLIIKSIGFVIPNPEDYTNIMTVTVFINNTLIVSNTRAVNGYPIIPYIYLTNGNFIFVTENDDYPNYLNFGNNQYLIYASPSEMAQIQAGTFMVPG